MKQIQFIRSRLTNPLYRKISLSLAAIAGYALLSAAMLPVLGDAAYDLSIFPIMLVSWLLGAGAGVVCSFLLVPMRFWLTQPLGPQILEEMFSQPTLQNWVMGLLTLIGGSYLTAYVHGLKNQLQVSEHKYRRLFEAVGEGIAIDRLVYDDAGHLVDWIITDVNPAYEKIVNLPRQKVIGQSAQAVYGDDAQFSMAREVYEQAVKEKTPMRGEARAMGSATAIRYTISPMTQDLLAVVFSDLSEQKQAIAAERAQRRLAEALRDNAAALTGTLDLDSILNQILVNLHEILAFDAVHIMLLNQNTIRVVRHAGYAERGLAEYIQSFNAPLEEMTGLQWIIQHGEALLIADTLDSPLWHASERCAWIRSYIGVPIQARGELIGFINFNSAVPNAFQPEQVNLLQPFADQAALAIISARVFADTRQRAHRLALINQIAHTLNQPLELSTVLQVTVNCLMNALNLAQVSVALINDTRDGLSIAADHPAPTSQSLVGSRISLENNPVMDYILREKKALLIEDVQQDERLAQARACLPPRGIIAMLLVPILARGEVIGTIGCDITEAQRRFTAEEIDLAQAVADLAAVRIEQARLYSEERRRASEMALLHVTGLEISQQRDLPRLLNTIIERAAWLMHAYGGTLYLENPLEQVLVCRVCHHLPHDEVGTVARYGEGAVGIVAETGQPLIVNDYAKWPHRVLNDDEIGAYMSVLSVPVTRQHQVTGVIQLARKDAQRDFTEQDIELLEMFSNQVAISLENAQLNEEIKQIAIQDKLTGLYNRRGLDEVGSREIERAVRYQRHLSALIIDVDHFKAVNDTYGHPGGDLVLAHIAGLCRKNLRIIDILGRYGGDEFIALLVEDDEDAAVKVAERILHKIAQTPLMLPHGAVTENNGGATENRGGATENRGGATKKSGDCIAVTVSIGVAELRYPTTDLTELIQQADAALYQAKRAGRNQVGVYGKGSIPRPLP